MEHALQFEASDVGFQSLGIPVDVLGGALVALTFGQLQKLAGIRNALGGALDLAGVGGQPGTLTPQLLCLFGLGPDGRVFELARNFL